MPGVVNMDCNHFDRTIEQLERDAAMPAGARAEALRHAETCPGCRVRLAAARVLSLELRALAADDQSMQAPAQMEAMLLAAFREHNRRRSAAWTWLRWAGAVAALVAVAFWLAAERPWENAVSAPAARIQAAGPPIAAQPVPRNAGAKRNNEVAIKGTPRTRSRPIPSQAAADASNEFIALTYGGSSYPVGDSMVVRVELPRSAPMLVGLPVGGGDISGTVTADVVLGQDGVARAIRFVTPEQGSAAATNLGFKQN